MSTAVTHPGERNTPRWFNGGLMAVVVVVVCDLQEPKRVGVAVDDSPTSREALQWALSHMLGPHDLLHIMCVAPPTPFPVG